MALEVPQPEDDGPKEVYAFYGLAMYSAQVLEHSVLNLSAGLFLTKCPVITREIFDAAFTDLGKKTVGELLRATRSLIEIPEPTDSILTDALLKRNYLTHRFFRCHAQQFCHDRGRRGMLAELQRLIAEFERADRLVTPIYMGVWAHFGVDEEWIAREVEAAQREMQDGKDDQ